MYDPDQIAVPQELLEKAVRWEELKRWERRELGQDLRRLGLSYREIREIVPVAQSTLSGWCRDIELTPRQKGRISAERARIYRQSVIGKRRSRKNTRRIMQIQDQAQSEALQLREDADWVLGAVAYWAEGTKGRGQVHFSNSDPAMVLLFMQWGMRYLDLTLDRFVVALHIHTGQNEEELKDFWSQLLGIDKTQFRKSFVKPEGTGHRKKRIYHGTVSVTVTKSSELHHRIMGWIEGLRVQSLLGYTQSGPLA